MSSLQDFDVKNLDFENMGSWPTPVKAVTGFIIFALVCFLGYQLAVAEQIDYLDSERNKETQKKQEFETKQRKAAHLDKYKEQMELIKGSFQTLLQQLPQSSEVASLVDEISYAATGAGLEVSKLELQDEVDKDVYLQQPISVEVYGSYHQLAEFVSRVSNLSRIVTLHDLEISTTDQPVFGSEGETILLLSVTANTYRYDDTREQAP